MVTKLETCAPLAAACEAPSAAPWRRLEILERLPDTRGDWAELHAIAPASAYQAYPFVNGWLETLGRAQGFSPAVVVARGGDGRALALLPLAVSQTGPLRVARFIGGRESNFNLGLFRPGAGFDATTTRRLLIEAAQRASIDLYDLRNMPRSFAGVANPLALSGATPSPSFAYGTTLPRDAAELKARLSKDSRKKLRKKEGWLAELGALVYEHAAEGARAMEIIDALVAQKGARLAAMGVGSAFATGEMRDFLVALHRAGALELHALRVGDRIAATYAGLSHGGRFSGLVNSFDPDEAFARSSPGDLLLQALLAHLVERGVESFDLGVGEARYKNAVCDETIELCDLAFAANWRGALAAPALSAVAQAKRRVKQTPWMMALFAKARRALG